MTNAKNAKEEKKVEGNEKDIEKGVDLTRTVSEIKPGTKVKLLLWHKGVTREVNVPVVEIDPPRKS